MTNIKRQKAKLDCLPTGDRKLKAGINYLHEQDKSKVAKEGTTVRFIMQNFLGNHGRLPRGKAFLRLVKVNGWFITDDIQSSNSKTQANTNNAFECYVNLC